MGSHRSLGPTPSLADEKSREEQGTCLEVCLGQRIHREIILKAGEGGRSASYPEMSSVFPQVRDTIHLSTKCFLPLPLSLRAMSGFLCLKGSSKSHPCPFSDWLSQESITMLLFVSQLLCCEGNEGSSLDQLGTPVPSLWYIVQGLHGIWVVTRTRWACGLGLLTCSSTHTSKKVITQELD